MKTYESERKKLHDWIDLKNKEQYEIEKNDTAKGHDSPLDLERRKVVAEYNRRLRKLKVKYGKEATAQESDTTVTPKRIHA